eukprot:337490-Alexandrium_andersonii.AAC.1
MTTSSSSLGRPCSTRGRSSAGLAGSAIPPAPEETAAREVSGNVPLLPAVGRCVSAPSSATAVAVSAVRGVPGGPRSPTSRGAAGVPCRVRRVRRPWARAGMPASVSAGHASG